MKRVLVLLIVAVAACAKTEHAVSDTAAAVTTTASTAQRVATSEAPARMIIRTANLSLIVRDAVDVLRKVTAAVENAGGYVVEARQWKERDQVRATASLRVPSAQLTATLAAIRGLAVRTESETMNAQDVTQEHSDLGAQLRNLQATETELRELLQTVRRRTQKASEIMEIFNELTKVRGDIERIETRLQYLSQMTSMSTITVELIPDVLAAPVVEPGWQPLATIKASSRALVNALKSITDVAIWVLLYLVPLGLVFATLGLLFWLVAKRVRKVRHELAGQSPSR